MSKVPGKGYGIYECKGKKNLCCKLNRKNRYECSIRKSIYKNAKYFRKVKDKADIIILDFHAEATAEKIAMGYYLDGKVTAIFGTHTHVQTADETILEKGTAYITDIGMTGPVKSVIGMDIDASIKDLKQRFPKNIKLRQEKQN